MCKEMPVIPINRVVDPKRIIKKMEGQGGGEAQGVADPPKKLPIKFGYFFKRKKSALIKKNFGRFFSHHHRVTLPGSAIIEYSVTRNGIYLESGPKCYKTHLKLNTTT
jgi:hypothetical protein